MRSVVDRVLGKPHLLVLRLSLIALPVCLSLLERVDNAGRLMVLVILFKTRKISFGWGCYQENLPRECRASLYKLFKILF